MCGHPESLRRTLRCDGAVRRRRANEGEPLSRYRNVFLHKPHAVWEPRRGSDRAIRRAFGASGPNTSQVRRGTAGERKANLGLTKSHITLQVQGVPPVALCRPHPVHAEVALMTFTLHAVPDAAAIAAIVGGGPGLKVSHSHAGGGVQWVRVAWGGREVFMERLDEDLAWRAFDPRTDDEAIGTGETPEDALRAALAHC